MSWNWRIAFGAWAIMGLALAIVMLLTISEPSGARGFGLILAIAVSALVSIFLILATYIAWSALGGFERFLGMAVPTLQAYVTILVTLSA